MSSGIQFDLATTRTEFPEDFVRPTGGMLLSIPEILARQSLARHPYSIESPQRGVRMASEQSFSLTSGADSALAGITRWRMSAPVVRMTPSPLALPSGTGSVVDVAYLNGFRLPVEELLEQDPAATLIVATPEPISGRIATVQEMVRLTRHFALVVMDERLTSFSLRRLTPMIDEWENVISLQQFAFRMPGETHDVSCIVHPTALRPMMQEHLDPIDPIGLEELARYGQIDTYAAERMIARLKGQLFRELRKLSIVSVPYPSWSNALLARVERGDRDTIVDELRQRGIAVYAPPQPNLRHHLRITAVSHDATDAVKQALIEINRGI